MKRIKLGDKVRDVVTGFEGIVVAETNWLYNCSRYTVQPPVDKDGKVPDNVTFDEQSLEVLKSKVIVGDQRPPEKKTGGSQNDKAALRRP